MLLRGLKLALASLLLTATTFAQGGGQFGNGGSSATSLTGVTSDGTTLAFSGTTIQTPQSGCAVAQALKFGSTATVGMDQAGTTSQIGMSDGTLCRFAFVIAAAPSLRVAGAGLIGWTNTAGDAEQTIDTVLSRNSAGHVQAGTSTSNSNGAFDAAGFFSKGTTFTSNAGCSETTLVGGATSGKLTAGATTSCTVIITMGNSMTAPNGWACHMTDLTTAADANNPHQSASTTTTATFITGTIVASDVLQFGCFGY